MNIENFSYNKSQEEIEKTEIMAEKEAKELLLTPYKGSKLLEMKKNQEAEQKPFTVIVTDIDNTFVREDRLEASKELTRKAEEENYPIIAVTGNDFESVKKRIEEGNLPYFQIIAGNVGTEIWILKEGPEGEKKYIKDEMFEKILETSGFNRKELSKRATELVERFQDSYPDAVFDFQNPEKEKDYLKGKTEDIQKFKISFFFFASNLEEIMKIAEEVNKKFPNQKIVITEEIGYSKEHPGEKRKKYCLDILPVTKAEVVNYLTFLTDIEQGIVAGDSGNDIDMLLNSVKLNAILVGGATPEAILAIESSLTGKKEGKRSFRIVTGSTGISKFCYTETGDELGPESILKAIEILERADRIRKIRKEK